MTPVSLLSEWFALYIFGVLADSAYCCVRPCAWLHVDELEAVVLKVQRMDLGSGAVRHARQINPSKARIPCVITRQD